MIFGFYSVLFILLHYYGAIYLQFPNKKYPDSETEDVLKLGEGGQNNNEKPGV